MTRASRSPQRRDAERSRRAILDAALEEFSGLGHAGARIDAIAARAGVSKPLIYSYFGDKDTLYKAALREAYVQIRSGENGLELDSKDPESAIRALVAFTLEHFRAKPWFVSMLNTENLRGGASIREMRDVGEIQSPLVAQVQKILERGEASGTFRSGVDPVDLYIAIASLCYFPISNRHTLRVVFNCPVDAEWLARRERDAAEMVLGFLRPRESAHA